MTRLAAAASAALLVAIVAAVVRADQGVDANIFKPALDTYGIFATERAEGPEQWDFGLRVGFDFAKAPLHITTPMTGSDVVISSQSTVDVAVSFGILDRLTFALDVPLTVQPLGAAYGSDGRYRPIDPTSPQFQPGTGFYSVRPDQNLNPSENGPGDPRVGLKLRVLAKGTWGAAVQAVLYAPFGDEDVFGGSDGFTFEPKLIIERRLGASGVVALNLGARLRDGTLVQTRRVNAQGTIDDDPGGIPVYQPLLYVGSEALASLGARIDLSARISVGAEADALIPISKASAAACGDGCRNGDLTADIIGGVFVALTSDTTLAVGGGGGVVSDAARRDSFRLLASISWAPSAEGGGAIRNDRDGDGIPDRDDLCPDEPEDKDGFQDEDGCPDPDNDGDGILDKDDKCPNEPETVNGVDDFDGCPDQAVQGGPRMAADRIDLQGERIEFVGKTARLTAGSQQTLEAVAQVMKAFPSVRVRIEVAVERSGDTRRARDADMRLTADRGRTIQQFLLGRGIRPAQVDVAPLGSDRPIDAKNPKDPRQNRRVELIRVTQ